MPHPTREALVRWAATAICCLVAVAYPLSYAPVLKFEKKRRVAELQSVHGDDRDFNIAFVWYYVETESTIASLYKPIDWLIDNTPLDKTLLAWARRWGVGLEFEMGRQLSPNVRRINNSR